MSVWQILLLTDVIPLYTSADKCEIHWHWTSRLHRQDVTTRKRYTRARICWIYGPQFFTVFSMSNNFSVMKLCEWKWARVVKCIEPINVTAPLTYRSCYKHQRSFLILWRGDHREGNSRINRFLYYIIVSSKKFFENDLHLSLYIYLSW